MEYSKKVRRVLWIILFLNLGVSIAKIIYGYLSNSLVMTADGYHSMGDGLSNVIGLVGIWIASRPPDENHPYGHQKFETYTTVGIAALLLFVCFEIIKGAVGRLLNPVVPNVTTATFSVMVITLVVNVFVYRYEVQQGRELHSDFLVSDAYHTRSDILVSTGTILGLIGVRLGFPWLDSVLGLVVAGLIAYSAWEIIRNSSQVLCDAAVLDPETVETLVTELSGVVDCHMVRSRGRSDSVYVDLHVGVAPDMTVEAAHDLIHRVEERIKTHLPGVEEVLVHIEPH